MIGLAWPYGTPGYSDMCHREAAALICDVIWWVKEVARRSVQMDYGGEKVRENVLCPRKKSVTSSTAIHRAFNSLVRPQTKSVAGETHFFFFSIKEGDVVMNLMSFGVA